MIITKVIAMSDSWINCGNLPSLPIATKLQPRNALPVASVPIDGYLSFVRVAELMKRAF